MRLYIAPMEGITNHVFRSVHHRYFPGADKYYTPFFSPTADGRFTGRSLRDLDPKLNRGLPVVPQLLTKHSADFLWAAKALADMGYSEINLNLGCPSGTVVAKGKGSGLLDHPAELKTLLDGIFDYPLKAEVSVKTRLGRKDPEEFPKLLELFNDYPISELTVHCRVRDDLYRRPAQPQWFALPLRESKNPVCYNGDLATAEAFADFQAQFPETPAAMLGRGVVADPALLRRIRGGPPGDRETLKRYTEELFETYSSVFGSLRSALNRMKEIWFYQLHLFEGAEKYEKKLRKTTDPAEYRALVERIFGELPLRGAGALPAWPGGPAAEQRISGET